MAFTGQGALKRFHLQKKPNKTPTHKTTAKTSLPLLIVHFTKDLHFSHLLTSHYSFHLACKIDTPR